ncbi:MAG TPA: DNA-directed RNA polymerase subunit alpha [Thermomicrobiales bacterium]|nr:DNA-directed RNA polymerase subunit alpha [Thermomicrobiales bacterium]
MSHAVLEMAQPKVEREVTGVNYGRFVIEPLEPGYGTTLGNSLRRILLRSLPGVAITRVRITDVWHEFSAIPNVKEDVTEIVLNLKRVNLQEVAELRGEARARLYAHGAREVTAGDIQWPGELACVNPEQHLATLDNDGATLELEVAIERGRGYTPAEAQESLTIGEIPLDAIFTPIKKVNYLVEHTRVGQHTDYDRLILEIVTNGTVDPADALSQAAQILVDYGQVIADFNRPEGKPLAAGGPYVSAEADAKPLAELGLPPRVLNALKSRGIERVGQVLVMDKDDLLSIRNFGPQSYKDLWTKLQEHHFIPEGIGEDLDADEAADDEDEEGEPLDVLEDLTPEAVSATGGEGEILLDEDDERATSDER